MDSGFEDKQNRVLLITRNSRLEMAFTCIYCIFYFC